MLNLNCIFRGKSYRFNDVAGWLISKKTSKPNQVLILDTPNEKAETILEYINNPYNTRPCPPLKRIKISSLIRLYAKSLIWFHKHFYPGIYIFSKIHLSIFENSVEAADAFCQIHPANQKVLCMPRSIFIATTSKSFKQDGALFIGAFLPSRHMHAWIIENGVNVYRNDFIWINFTPICMMI